MKKNEEFEKNGFSGFCGEKLEMGGNGGRRWVIMAGERPAVGRGWWVCSGWRWVRRIWMIWEEEWTEEGLEGAVRPNGEMGKMGEM
jgi:hypothetical protein